MAMLNFGKPDFPKKPELAVNELVQQKYPTLS